MSCAFLFVSLQSRDGCRHDYNDDKKERKKERKTSIVYFITVVSKQR